MTPLEAFHRGGGHFTWEEWSKLGAEDQADSIEMVKKLTTEDAALVTYYMLNPGEALALVIGEDAAVRAALEGKLK
jgi:hypothetical protein